ncbi:MAG TPA: adenylyltransferase/cytidyltransferase family protein, partial [Casimicrobiaceae bacterium]
MMKVVYPGTFDPFTRGHEDLVRRASRLFDRVVVGVADSETKRPFFTVDERIAMAREV